MFGVSATTLAAIAVGTAAASAGISAYSAHEQANAQKQAGNYNAQVARNNATIALQQRSSSLQQGDVEAQQAQMNQAQVLGTQRARLAANGIDLTQGSAQDLLTTTKFLGAQDVNTIQSNAARAAWGYSAQNMNDNATASLTQWQADSASPGKVAAMAGASSLLGSASAYPMSKAGSSKKNP
jgi:hypothetical protein